MQVLNRFVPLGLNFVEQPRLLLDLLLKLLNGLLDLFV
jgi:hypothetical protein